MYATVFGNKIQLHYQLRNKLLEIYHHLYILNTYFHPLKLKSSVMKYENPS